jgi:hypothetical protein
MSKDAKKHLDLVLVILILVSAAGITSVFWICRILAWVVIVCSDLYLSIVLLLAALLSDDEDFLSRHPWMSGFLPRRRTAGLLVVALLFVAVISGFAGLYVGTEVFSSVKTPLDALYISSFTLALTDYSPKPGYGQLVVLGQLVSSILLLVALFPLLISRISTFKHP